MILNDDLQRNEAWCPVKKYMRTPRYTRLKPSQHVCGKAPLVAVFLQCPHLTPCVLVIGWGLHTHCSKVDTQKTSRAQPKLGCWENKQIQAEGRVPADKYTTIVGLRNWESIRGQTSPPVRSRCSWDRERKTFLLEILGITDRAS